MLIISNKKTIDYFKNSSLDIFSYNDDISEKDFNCIIYIHFYAHLYDKEINSIKKVTELAKKKKIPIIHTYRIQKIKEVLYKNISKDVICHKIEKSKDSFVLANFINTFNKFEHSLEESSKQLKDIKWKKQDNKMDYDTKFIYKIETYNDLLKKTDGLDTTYTNYALKRWYNHKVSSIHEAMFQFIPNLKLEKKDNAKWDIIAYWNKKEIKIDLKSTNLMSWENKKDSKISKILNDNNALKEEENKHRIIEILYDNQSRGQRYAIDNRVFMISKQSYNKHKNLLLFFINIIRYFNDNEYSTIPEKTINLKKIKEPGEYKVYSEVFYNF